MNKFVKVLATSVLALSFAAVSAMADKPTPAEGEEYNGNNMPSGKHFQFSLIGSPNGISASDKSNGGAIMIPLGAVRSSKAVSCNDGTFFDDDTGGYLINEYPLKGTKILFTPVIDGDYKIIDRDATDGEAEIELPVTADGSTEFDVYIRVLGKPSQCMKIDGYAELAQDTTEDGTVDLTGWLNTGHIELTKNHRSVALNITNMFEVKWCDNPITDDTGTYCAKKDYTSYSVFDSIFSEYFWDVQNSGTRNVQVRFYPKAP